ncbi:PREDICTED: DNA topoisomerase 1 alpha [Tarenaya hassleriana]|uniref:DNA topoisomerase 1 alpha n=1 Tax=Tarenaya hassleriana TaxID=28532 RepID=UPI00053C53C1|nr:PREDICTED: DNA topoisomerase 1 alpha [Tarenaya hassleriana]XP_010545255.1 PREDICTED: DNA topoisomerase 1 alpha [Tarenaya hassleriana]XP_010545256.1 PREDICTED: DNA topoisomerase 1 alpha [Tarenaya hassleriana]
MATEAFVKAVVPNGHDGYDDDDDDEMPLVFKRSSNVASNSNHSKADARKSTGFPSSKASPMRSPLTSPNRSTSSSSARTSVPKPSMPSTSSARTPVMKPSVPSASSAKPPVSASSSAKLPVSASSSAKPPVSASSSAKAPVSASSSTKLSSSYTQASTVKSPIRNDRVLVGKEGNRLLKDPSEFKCEEEDSDDDKPLSARVKGDSNQLSKGPSSSARGNSQLLVEKSSGRPPLVKLSRNIKNEELDDEAPISSKVQIKTSVGALSKKPIQIQDKKSMANKIHQNGFTPKSEGRNSEAPAKRPLEKGSSSDQSFVKKPKLLDSSTSVKTKQGPVKADVSDDKRKILNVSKSAKADQVSVKEDNSDDDDHVPIAKRMKPDSSTNKSSAVKPNVKKQLTSSKMITRKPNSPAKDSKYSKSSKSLPSGDGQKKWTTLEHNGVIFPPPYKPHGVKMLYQGKPVDLTPEQEEVATMIAVMRDTDYYNKPTFRENFWNDWQKILGKNHVIQKLDDCDFTPIYEWHMREKEKKKQMSAEEKKALKEEKLKQEEKYMWAIVDGVKEKVGNFRVEPPGLFRGRGEHPKMGKLKNRIHPCDITINIGKEAPVPECPIPGESWKEVKHDNTVTWLAFWNDPINPKEFKYVFLAASSSLKGQSDKEKYEKARKLKDHIGSIRAAYTKNFMSKDVTKRQIAVATYLIDKLALRAGNEKDDDEADTVGCCTLKVGNVECIPPNKLKFDFLGKDSIQYVNTVEVEPPVYKAIGQFQAGKSKTDDLFDELDTSKLNAHLKELMPGLTAKVFRTYNASITLDVMLSKETRDGEVGEKVVVYQQANKQVAIICNHQRSVSKSHGAQIERLAGKIEELRELLEELNSDLDRARKGKPPLMGSDGKRRRNLTPEALEKKIAQTNAKIEKMERDMQTKEDMKTVALGTSKINYLDPRISVAWCKRHDVPIEKIFNKSLLAKFAWAMDVDPEFRF